MTSIQYPQFHLPFPFPSTLSWRLRELDLLLCLKRKQRSYYIDQEPL